MPWQEPEAEDPMELRAHAVPAEAGSLDSMAEALVDEFVRLGAPAEQILQMFRDPFFALTHAIWQRRGDGYCTTLVERVTASYRWGGEP